jgi:hypothetical protein
MVRHAITICAMLLAACGGEISSQAEEPEWLVGSWLPVGSDTPYPLACESDAVVIYEDGGQFHFEVGSGTWTWSRGELIETVTTVHDPEPETPIVAEPERSRVERLDTDRFRKHHAGGETVDYRRCPSA